MLDIVYPEPLFYQWCLIWAVVWIIILVIPPGSKEIITAYRLNFCHGVTSSVVALLCMYGYIHEDIASPCTISYFVVDFLNIMLNDFVFRVPSYQNPQNRRVEYGHHLFCLFVGISAQLCYKNLCVFSMNPFIQLMFAEFSTPFLIAWRHYGHDILAALFGISFFVCRIIYHGFYFIPECMRSCVPWISYPFAVLYDCLNLYFFYMIIRKLLKPPKKIKEGK